MSSSPHLPTGPARPLSLLPGALMAAAILAGCSSYSSPTGTTTASGIAVVSGNAQVGIVGAGLALPLVVRVADAYGTGMSGVTVNFVATGGATLRSATATTDVNGRASDSLTVLGSVAGAGTVTATASGVTGSAVFTFTANAAGIVARAEN
jgi:adhesin/invasin